MRVAAELDLAGGRREVAVGEGDLVLRGKVEAARCLRAGAARG